MRCRRSFRTTANSECTTTAHLTLKEHFLSCCLHVHTLLPIITYRRSKPSTPIFYIGTRTHTPACSLINVHYSGELESYVIHSSSDSKRREINRSHRKASKAHKLPHTHTQPLCLQAGSNSTARVPRRFSRPKPTGDSPQLADCSLGTITSIVVLFSAACSLQLQLAECPKLHTAYPSCFFPVDTILSIGEKVAGEQATVA
jgi:hypothetical protein